MGNKVLPDPRNYGEITVSRVIEKSSQVGVTKMAQAIGHEHIIDVFQRFGLGQLTGAEFPGERAGRYPIMISGAPLIVSLRVWLRFIGDATATGPCQCRLCQ